MKKIYCLLFLITALICKAQNPGDVAQNFGAFLGLNGSISTLAVQTDGKIILAGFFSSYNGISESSIMRLNADGTRDTSFNTTGTGFIGSISSIGIQSDGKIIAGGLFTTYNGETVNRIIRLNTNGTRDTSFATGTGFNNNIKSITVQTDGKILLGGDFTTYNGLASNRIIRLNADGTRDASFTIGTGCNSSVNSIAMQTDGKILVGGNFSTFNGVALNRIIRLNTDGTLDTTFTIGTGCNNAVNSIVLQSDGKIILGGNFTLFNGVASSYLIRLNADGTINTAGTGINNTVVSVALQSDGKLVIGGNFTSVNGITANRIVRLNADGTNDDSFTSGLGFNSGTSSIALQADGKILVSGFYTSYNGLLENPFIRLNANGIKDTSFASFIGTGFNSTVLPIATQSDGKVLLGGAFTVYNGTNENRIIRLNADGTKDTSFNTGSGFNGGITRSIIVQSDGKILVAGQFTSYNGVTENRIIRLNSDGTRDTSFTTGTGINQTILSMALQSDGKILIVGLFTLYNGVTEYGIIRLNPNGTKDTSFNVGTGFPVFAFIYSVVIQADGKILVGGDIASYNGVAASKIIRLNADGTRDTSFNTGTGFTGAQVECIAVQSDGKILAGGSFTAYNGITENNIIRLNADGTKDTSFNSGTGFNSTVSSIAIKSDGKILVGGGFTTYNGVTENYIIRLNANGTKDTSFNTGTGFNGAVSSITEQTGGKILVGGSFTIYKGSNSSAYLISLHNNDTLSSTTFTSSSDFTLWPNPVQDVLHIDAVETTTVLSVALYDLQGKLLNKNTFDGNAISVSNLSAGLYLVKIKTNDGEFTKKFIKE